MSQKTPYRLVIKDGKQNFIDRELFKTALESLKDGEYALHIKKKSKLRSTQQNNYLWSLYTILAQSFGWDVEEMHDFLRARFLYTIKEVGGDKYKVLSSTTKLTTKEFMEYIQKIQKFGAEHGVFLPNPDEYYLL